MTIAADEQAPTDLRAVFARILPGALPRAGLPPRSPGEKAPRATRDGHERGMKVPGPAALKAA